MCAITPLAERSQGVVRLWQAPVLERILELAFRTGFCLHGRRVLGPRSKRTEAVPDRDWRMQRRLLAKPKAKNKLPQRCWGLNGREAKRTNKHPPCRTRWKAMKPDRPSPQTQRQRYAPQRITDALRCKIARAGCKYQTGK